MSGKRVTKHYLPLAPAAGVNRHLRHEPRDLIVAVPPALRVVATLITDMGVPHVPPLHPLCPVFLADDLPGAVNDLVGEVLG